MNKLKIIIGQDMSAYAEIDAPADTDLSEENLIEIAYAVAENVVFDADWSTVNGLRVVSVHDEDGKIVKSDIAVAPSIYDGGVSLQAFLKGNGHTIKTLVESAAIAKLIEQPEEAAYTGHLSYPGGQFTVEFSARNGATQAELDLAFLQGLAQLCTIGYNVIGKELNHA